MEVHKIEKKSTILNVTNAKIIGLYQILDPDFPKFGNNKVYHVIFKILIFYLLLVSTMLAINGVLFWTNYIGQGNETVLAIVCAYSFIFSSYKMFIIVTRSNDILDCLSITRFDFTSIGRWHTRLLELWRHRSIKFTNMYMYATCFSVSLFVLCPLCFADKVTAVTAVDGSVGHYRVNVLNMYTLFSAETYNAYYFMMYLIEATCLMLYVYFSFMFDTLLAELCISFVCQLKIINTAIKLSGHESTSITDRQQKNNTNEEIEPKTTNKQHVIYNELESFIKNHQAIIEKLERLFSIFGNIVLSQIYVSSSMLVIIWFTIIKKYTEENIQTDNGSTTIIAKFLISCPPLIFQLFMSCYLFELVNNEKGSIIFSLYSSNWTQMDVKYRNLILLTIKMNNAHPKKLKFSQLRVVNLQMFLGTMHVCYSVVSVMLNAI